ncbi:MAG: thioredoxin family protein [Halapricum sp.]
MSGTNTSADGSDGLSPEERLEILEEEGVVAVDEDDTVTLTLEFESTRGIYHDSYADVDEEKYHRAVADVFGFTLEEAAERIEEFDVTREQFIALLALNSHLDGDYPLAERTEMAMMITDLVPPSPIPDALVELDDDSYEEFLSEHDRVAVIVWKRFCDPCRKMKEELGETLSVLPDDVAVAGVDGEATPDFCRSFGVEAAPSVLFFADGELLTLLRGYKSPQKTEAACEDIYGDE